MPPRVLASGPKPCGGNNNQSNVRVVMSQSAVVYCPSKLMENRARLLNYYIKAIEHKFLWFI